MRRFHSFVLFMWRPKFHVPYWASVDVGFGPLRISSRASAVRIARTLMRDNFDCPVVVVGVGELPRTVGEIGRVLLEIAGRLPSPGGDVDFSTGALFDGRLELV